MNTSIKSGMKKLLCIALLLACLLLGGCGAKDPFEGIPNPVATITLSDGQSMRFELFLQDAPNTVANFVALAQEGYYDGLRFFRVVPGVLAQTGDKKNSGTGNAGYFIQGEFAANGIQNDVKHIRGTLSMCRQEDNMDSASSQFFIVANSYPEYDGQYAAFGRAMDEESLRVVDALTSQPVDSAFSPIGTPPSIRSISMETYGYKYTAAKIELPTVASALAGTPQ